MNYLLNACTLLFPIRLPQHYIPADKDNVNKCTENEQIMYQL